MIQDRQCIANILRQPNPYWNLSHAHSLFSKYLPGSVTEQMDSALCLGVKPTLAVLTTAGNLTEAVRSHQFPKGTEVSGPTSKLDLLRLCILSGLLVVYSHLMFVLLPSEMRRHHCYEHPLGRGWTRTYRLPRKSAQPPYSPNLTSVHTTKVNKLR